MTGMHYPDERGIPVEFGPDGRLYAHVSPDALTADAIADEGFRGPRYRFRVDNGSHQGGSHVHLYERGDLTNLCFTRIGDQAVAYTHCEGKSTIKIERLSRSAIKHLMKDRLEELLAKDRPWTRDVDPNKVITSIVLS